MRITLRAELICRGVIIEAGPRSVRYATYNAMLLTVPKAFSLSNTGLAADMLKHCPAPL